MAEAEMKTKEKDGGKKNHKFKIVSPAKYFHTPAITGGEDTKPHRQRKASDQSTGSGLSFSRGDDDLPEYSEKPWREHEHPWGKIVSQ